MESGELRRRGGYDDEPMSTSRRQGEKTLISMSDNQCRSRRQGFPGGAYPDADAGRAVITVLLTMTIIGCTAQKTTSINLPTPPEGWSGTVASADAPSAWLSDFNDAQLNKLVDEALRKNWDRRLVAARLRAAGALARPLERILHDLARILLVGVVVRAVGLRVGGFGVGTALVRPAAKHKYRRENAGKPRRKMSDQQAHSALQKERGSVAAAAALGQC